jgi:hypothetical protein
VQLVNRVTWDNIIIPTEPTELGWKDTIRVAPLEDTIVALRPIIPEIPWELPNAIRELNPMMPDKSDAMFFSVDTQGVPTEPILNQLVNFGWEYVYHCHILSHEEMDMMRPVSVALPPVQPDGLTAANGIVGGDLAVSLSWNDNSIAETSYEVERSEDAGVNWEVVGSIASPLDQVNTTTATTGLQKTFDDTTVLPATAYQYRIVAKNTVGYVDTTDVGVLPPTLGFPFKEVHSVSTVVDVTSAIPPSVPAAPTDVTAALVFGPQVDLQWTHTDGTATGFTIQRCAGAGCNTFDPAGIDGVGAAIRAYTDTTVLPGTTYGYRIVAFNAAGPSPASAPVAYVTIPPRPLAPTNIVLTVQGSLTLGPRIRVVFRDNQNGGNPETGFQLFRSTDGVNFSLLATLPPRGGVGNIPPYYDYDVTGGAIYWYYAVTINAGSASLPSNTNFATLPPVPAAPSNFLATTQVTNGGTTARVNMIWMDNSNNESRFVIQRATDENFTTGLVSFNRGANSTTFNNTGLPRNTTFYYRIMAQNPYGQSAWVNLTPFPIVTP